MAWHMPAGAQRVLPPIMGDKDYPGSEESGGSSGHTAANRASNGDQEAVLRAEHERFQQQQQQQQRLSSGFGGMQNSMMQPMLGYSGFGMAPQQMMMGGGYPMPYQQQFMPTGGYPMMGSPFMMSPGYGYPGFGMYPQTMSFPAQQPMMMMQQQMPPSPMNNSFLFPPSPFAFPPGRASEEDEDVGQSRERKSPTKTSKQSPKKQKQKPESQQQVQQVQQAEPKPKPPPAPASAGGATARSGAANPPTAPPPAPPPPPADLGSGPDTSTPQGALAASIADAIKQMQKSKTTKRKSGSQPLLWATKSMRKKITSTHEANPLFDPEANESGKHLHKSSRIAELQRKLMMGQHSHIHARVEQSRFHDNPDGDEEDEDEEAEDGGETSPTTPKALVPPPTPPEAHQDSETNPGRHVRFAEDVAAVAVVPGEVSLTNHGDGTYSPPAPASGAYTRPHTPPAASDHSGHDMTYLNAGSVSPRSRGHEASSRQSVADDGYARPAERPDLDIGRVQHMSGTFDHSKYMQPIHIAPANPTSHEQGLASMTNGTGTICDILQMRAQLNPKDTIFTVVDSHGHNSMQLKYAQLYKHARSLGEYLVTRAHLKSVRNLHGSDDGGPELHRPAHVALLFDHHSPLSVANFAVTFFACLMGGIVPIPVPLPTHAGDDEGHTSYVGAVLSAAHVHVALTDDVTMAQLPSSTSRHDRPGEVRFPKSWPRLKVIDCSKAPSIPEKHWGKMATEPSDDGQPINPADVVAFVELDLTSHEDGARGLAISHRQLMQHAFGVTHALFRETHIIATALDPRRWAGLWFGLIVPVFAGQHAVVLLSSASSETDGKPKDGLAILHSIEKLQVECLIGSGQALSHLLAPLARDENAVAQSMRKRKSSSHTVLPLAAVRHVLFISDMAPPLPSHRLLQTLSNVGLSKKALHTVIWSLHGHLTVHHDANKHETTTVSLSRRKLLRRHRLAPPKLPSTIGANQEERRSTSTKYRRDIFTIFSAGRPLPGQVLAVIDQDSEHVCRQDEVGEIVIMSNTTASRFCGQLRRQSEHAFFVHIRDGHGNPVMEDNFTRTGLVGFTIRDQVYVLGSKADVLPVDKSICLRTMMLSTLQGIPQAFGLVDTTEVGMFTTKVYRAPRLVVVLRLEKEAAQKPNLDETLQQLSTILIEKCRTELYCYLYTVAVVPFDGLAQTHTGRVDDILMKMHFERGRLNPLFVLVNAEGSVANLPFNLKSDQQQVSPAAPFGSAFGPLAAMATQQPVESAAFASRVDDQDVAGFATAVEAWAASSWLETGSVRSIGYVSAAGTEEFIAPKELAKRIRRLSGGLNKLGIETGHRVLVMLPPGPTLTALFNACTALGVVPCPVAAPVDLEDAESAVPFLLQAAAAMHTRFIITCERVWRVMKALPAGVLKAIPRAVMTESLAAKELPHRAPRASSVSHIEAHTAEMGDIMGLEFTHGAVLRLAVAMKSALTLSSEDTLVVALSTNDGLGLSIWTQLPPLLPCKLLLVELGDDPPENWLRVVSRHRATKALVHYTAMFSPVDAYFSGNLKLEDLQGSMNLDSLQSCLVIACTRPWNTLNSTFETLFQSFGLKRGVLRLGLELPHCPLVCFTPPESGSEDSRPLRDKGLFLDNLTSKLGKVQLMQRGSVHETFVGCLGRPSPGTVACIVNPITNQLTRPDQMGELWLHGDHVCKHARSHDSERRKQYEDGKLRREIDLSNIQSEQDKNKVKLLKKLQFAATNLVGFVHENELYVVGRSADTVVSRGFRFDPLDLEETIERCHKDIRLGGATVVNIDQWVVAAVEVDDKQMGLNVAPLVTAALINEHEIVCHVIILVERNFFPISLKGDKRRLTIMQSLLAGQTTPLYIIFNTARREEAVASATSQADLNEPQ